ncbi:hypothetical protein [Bradyrhizobium sp. DASA03120]|uniref:hypothetical protein n=1 Tax=Bradyrhizobium sp. SMVTL-02 TaxID=3395917 RepID=UPI003F6F2F69
MPINRLLEGSDLTPEQRHVYELAFNAALRKLDLVDRSLVARKIIEIGSRGVTNALALAEMASKQLDPR